MGCGGSKDAKVEATPARLNNSDSVAPKTAPETGIDKPAVVTAAKSSTPQVAKPAVTQATKQEAVEEPKEQETIAQEPPKLPEPPKASKPAPQEKPADTPAEQEDAYSDEEYESDSDNDDIPWYEKIKQKDKEEEQSENKEGHVSIQMEDLTLEIRRAKRGNATRLDLSGRGISLLPFDLYSLPRVEELNLSNNNISMIESAISGMTSLRLLNLAGNQITALPSEIMELDLTELNLERNPIGLGNLLSFNIKRELQSHFGGGSRPGLAPPPARIGRPGSATQRPPSATFRPPSATQREPMFDRTAPSLAPIAKPRPQMFQGVAEIDLSEIKEHEMVSQGGFAVVHTATWRGSLVAVKKIFNPVITQELRDEFENEIYMLSYLRHPHTMLAMGVSMKPPNLALVAEYVENGSLHNFLHRNRARIPIETRMQIIQQVAQAILYYHEAGVVHRDIKALNVLLDGNLQVKMCDFGLARFRYDLNTGSMQFSGTPSYMAPELFLQRQYTEKVDVFAFGTLLWEILAQEIPLDGLDPGAVKARVLSGDARLELPYEHKAYQDLVDACRATEPELRPGMQQVYDRLTS